MYVSTLVYNYNVHGTPTGIPTRDLCRKPVPRPDEYTMEGPPAKKMRGDRKIWKILK